MRQRRDRLLFGVLVGLMAVATLEPLVVVVVQVVRDPPPEHLELILFGAVGEAIDRLLWSLGLAAVVLVLRRVAAAIHSERARKQEGHKISHVSPKGATDERVRAIGYPRGAQPT